jgi:hypothetical protein
MLAGGDSSGSLAPARLPRGKSAGIAAMKRSVIRGKTEMPTAMRSLNGKRLRRQMGEGDWLQGYSTATEEKPSNASLTFLCWPPPTWPVSQRLPCS